MIDGIIKSVIDSASPAITKWRTAFLILALIFISPELDELFSVSLLSVNLKQLTLVFGDLLASSKALSALGISCCFYVFVPYVNYGVLRFFISKNIGSAEPLLEKIGEMRKNDKETIENIIEESFDVMKDKSNSSSIKIAQYKELSEISIMSLVMYLVSSLYLDVFNLYFAMMLFSVYVVASYFVSRTILLVYLRDVASFKVIEDYVKYFVLVK
jgi:hypothetical protein